MSSLACAVRKLIFGIHAREASFARRRFEPTADERRARLELIGETFIAGYNAYLRDALDEQLSVIAPELRGFAVEGAAMACSLLDYTTPWRRDRLAGLLEHKPEHRYMIHVGAGWAAARLRRSLRAAVTRRDPLLGWLVADGWGFHQAYFRTAQWASGQRALPTSAGYLRRAADQGIGRALWFVTGADPRRVAARIERFAADRRGDLWSGIGLAAAYAGGVPDDDLALLGELSGAYRGELAQGTAFAATARTDAGNLAPHVDAAAQALTGRTALALATLARSLQPTHHGEGAYEEWRRALTQTLVTQEAA